MSRAIDERTPVAIVTGFLGSGKTTLLARFVQDTGLAGTAFIVNEFGEIGLDRALVTRGSEESAVLLDSGCLCCTLNDSIETTLESLYYQRVRGEITPFTRVVVETTGLADPAPIANAIAANSTIARRFRLAGIMTTVDAEQGSQTLGQFEEARLQVAMADTLAFTKADLADPLTMGEARKAALMLNPHARALSMVHGDAAQRALLELLEPRDMAQTNAPARGPVSADDAIQVSEHAHEAHRHEGDHVAKHGFESCVVRLSRPLSMEQYFAWADRLRRELGDRLLRAKGIIRLYWNGEDEAAARFYAIQGVRHVFYAPAALDWTPGAAVQDALVLIARDTPKARLRELAHA